MLGLAVTGRKMLEEGENAAARRGDNLAAIGVDDCERPVVSQGSGKDRIEALLVGGVKVVPSSDRWRPCRYAAASARR